MCYKNLIIILAPTSPLKALTHRLLFRGFVAELAVESADSSPESADCNTHFMPVGQLFV